MKLLKSNPNKSKAQAMVEFALVLPILLVLLYGILEVGRLLFLYSTVVTASRQAARYGSTTGEGGTSGQPRYQDCDGIREAAQNYAILGAFDPNDITIKWDKGPADAPNAKTYCSGSYLPPTQTDLASNDRRIVVTVEDEFVPLVALVPLEPRTISATSSRTIFISVPIVVDSPDELVTQDPTRIQITSDSPDASEMDQAVTVSVTVENYPNDPTKIPTGTVIIADSVDPTITCEITLANGSGSCIITYATVGVKTITALYTGDDEHTASDTAEGHMVDLADTFTTITASPDPSAKNEDVIVVVSVTGGSTTPTGTVSISGGGGATCTITLAFGAGSCTISFNNTGPKTITANYNGDSQHNPSSDTEAHQVLQGTPTPTLPPTATLISTPTLIPTITPLPATPITGCEGALTLGLLQRSGNSMLLSVTNSHVAPLQISVVNVQWDHDKGHQGGNNKTLQLQSVSLGGIIWTGNEYGPSYPVTPTSPGIFPAGSISTLAFTFQQDYDNPQWDGTESVTINLSTPGCEGLVFIRNAY